MSKIADNFIDVIHSKNISLDLMLNQDISTKMNPTLAEILITNLLQNAIRHNTENGQITIELKENSISIFNTGNPLTIPEEQLFMRFKKNDASKESLGLGLYIVNSIAKSYGFDINYSYINSSHYFKVAFN